MDQQLYSFEEKVKTLNDQNLVEQVRQLFHREKRLGDAILLGLKEIKERRIYAAMGYSNLFEMLIKFYHLSETASYQRVNALKLIESVPEAQDVLFNGEVSLSNAAMVQSFIQRSEKDFKTALSSKEKLELIESIKGKTHKEAQVALAEINPVAVLPSNKEKPLSKSHTQLQIVADQETMALLKQVQELLSHTIPDGDYNEILKYMGKHMTEILRKKKGLNSNNPKRIGTKPSRNAISEVQILDTTATACISVSKRERASAVKQPSTNIVISSSANAVTDASKRSVPSRYISRNVKRVIFERAGGQCEFIGTDGHRCESHHQLEIDHVIPWSFGGGNNEGNCRLLCKTHNNYRTKETHGYWFKYLGQDGSKLAKGL
ncbi:MAG: HNH endonuclease [Bdellovibrio sp.]